MSVSLNTPIGSVNWTDLTVDNADPLREFYREVVGWQVDDISMGDYNDYCMNDSDGNPVAGVCHNRGVNEGIPPQWLIYITVADLNESVSKCVELGGKVLHRPEQPNPQGSYCVIQDPAGAVCALFQPTSEVEITIPQEVLDAAKAAGESSESSEKPET